MRLAIVQMEVVNGRPDLNAKKIKNWIEEAKGLKAEVIIFPKNAISGNDEFMSETFIKDCKSYEEEILNCNEDVEIILNDKSFEQFNLILDRSAFSINKKFSPTIGKPTIYVNAVGLEDEGKRIKVLEGGSAVYNAKGELIFRAKRFEESVNIFDFEVIDNCKVINENISKTAQIYEAISYGVKKFLERINMKKVVIGVSGGIDSAVNAAIYTKILGNENVFLINMPSKFNSATTKGLANQLANNLGCKYFVVPIQESVDHTVNQLEEIMQMKVTSFNKENIQARDRSSRVLAAIASMIGGGFTCNANKTETTIGYATMYGDCAGFLSALADCWKYQVYDLANYLNEDVYRREVIPQGIIDIVPSAELSTAQNVDEGKGDPVKYPYHDYLFKAFVESNVSPEEILNWYAEGNLESKIGCESNLIEKYFTSAEEFINDLERWWRQFKGIAVAKRLQAPPLIAITDRAFGFSESQSGIYYTKAYEELKNKLLSK